MEFLAQLGILILSGLPAFLWYGRASNGFGGYADFVYERGTKLVSILGIYIAVTILTVSGQVDVVSAISTGLGVAGVGSSIGFGFGVSFLMLK